jgi:hypothetical protein
MVHSMTWRMPKIRAGPGLPARRRGASGDLHAHGTHDGIAGAAAVLAGLNLDGAIAAGGRPSAQGCLQGVHRLGEVMVNAEPGEEFALLRRTLNCGFRFNDVPIEPDRHVLVAWFRDDAGIPWQLDEGGHLAPADNGYEIVYKQ